MIIFLAHITSLCFPNLGSQPALPAAIVAYQTQLTANQMHSGGNLRHLLQSKMIITSMTILAKTTFYPHFNNMS